MSTVSIGQAPYRSRAFPYIYKLSVTVFIKCGSRNETEETSGAAHFLEHLHFKVVVLSFHKYREPEGGSERT
jgi:hypothetical protein